MKEGIAAEYAVRTTYKADTTGRVARSVQHLECQCAERECISFFQQHVRFSLDERRWTIEHFCSVLISIHINIGGMNCHWPGIPNRPFLNSSVLVNLSFGGDVLFRLDLYTSNLLYQSSAL